MSDSSVRIGIIGGTGLEEALGTESGEKLSPDTPFGPAASPITVTRWQGVDVAIVQRHGPGHVLNPSAVPYRANIFALKSLGVTHIIASGACGSLVEEIEPRQLVVADQVIDKTFKRPNSFFDGLLAVHVDFAYPFCNALRQALLNAAATVDTQVHDRATYVCMEGPHFSTRAESLLHRQSGGQLIGMTCMPEAKLAREAEMCYALLALPTDYDCWRQHPGDVDKHSLMTEIIANLNDATENAIKLITAALPQVAQLLDQQCEHQNALELGIWSDKYRITPEALQKTALLINRYLP